MEIFGAAPRGSYNLRGTLTMDDEDEQLLIQFPVPVEVGEEAQTESESEVAADEADYVLPRRSSRS